jgi:hypothetical protein
MFYSVPLIVTAGAKFLSHCMRHAARLIPFEGLKLHDVVKFCPSADFAGEMLQLDAVRKLKRDAAKLQICANQVNWFYIGSPLF